MVLKGYRIELVGYGKDHTGSGDIVTRDGEILGTWTADENDIFGFIPNGATEPVLRCVFVPRFIEAVERWIADQA